MADYLLIAILIISFITDIKKKRIYNIVTIPAITAGIIYHSFVNGWDGFLFSTYGFLLGFALLLIPYLLGGIGAGDVKLLAAIGALKGVSFVFYTFLSGAVIGGMVALVILIKNKMLISSLKRIYYALLLVKADKDSLNMADKKGLTSVFPYGAAIILGTIPAFYLGGF